jgi:TolB-like protein/Tfp pilus assembly protein PilF
LKKFIEELKRRNVIKASLAYLVIAWVLLQVFEILLPMLGAPEWLLPTLTLIMAIGFPIWVIVSWVYDITPQGIEKTTKESENELVTQATNKRLNAFIIISLSIAVIVLVLKVTNVFADSDGQYAIAILPFDNIQVDKGNEWLSESFTQSVNSNISKVSKLQVTDSYSTGKYKDSDKTNTEIAKELDVIYILRGTVTQLKNKLSITVELIDVVSKKVVWSENYEGVFDENTLNIQQQISQQIVQKLKIKLTPQEDEILKEFPTENMEAYSLFSKGRLVLVNNSRKKEDLELNIALNKQAVALDSNFAEAYAELAHSYYLMQIYGGMNWKEAFKKSKYYAEKALKINPNTSRAYMALAMMLWEDKDWDKAKEYHEKAIALNPNDAVAQNQYGRYFLFIPNPNLNNYLIHLRIAEKLNPLSMVVGGNFFMALIFNDKIEEAEEYSKKYSFLDEKVDLWRKRIIEVYKNKDWTEDIRFLENELKKDPNSPYLHRLLGVAYDGILNDDVNAIKYTKKAYEIDTTNSTNAVIYFNLLVEGKQFKEAKKLLQSQNFKSIRSKSQQLRSLWYYYYHQENYTKAQDVLKDSLIVNAYREKIYTYAQLGDRKTIDSLFKEDSWSDNTKVFVYAILKEKDSMYHFLEKIISIYGINGPNSRREFDPYRKEERYKALLKKNYLPITHWNEE